jgi:PAS domain-containing protein
MNAGRQKDVVLILARELASNLATPMLVLDHNGALIFFNEAAEAIMGATFATVGEIPAAEWAQKWPTADESGSPISLLESPLARAVTEQEPAHQVIVVTGLDGVKRRLSTTVYPLFGSGRRFVGAQAVFWQEGDDT